MPEKDKYILEVLAPGREVLRREETKAFSKEQAWRNFRIRAAREGWFHLLRMDNLDPHVFKAPVEVVHKAPKNTYKPSWDICPKCKGKIEDDYCQGCGWQRYSSWYSKTKAKQS
jgi:hypothetical protein